MNVFEMVVLIVVVSAGASVLKSYFKRKNAADSENFMDNLGETVDARVSNTLTPCMQKITALEERIQILERIVTDKNHNLAAKIDNLR